jgi:hypothetical protein
VEINLMKNSLGDTTTSANAAPSTNVAPSQTTPDKPSSQPN